MKRYPVYQQLDTMDCGPTCLRMVAKYHGRHFSLQTIREKCNPGKDGVSLSGLSEAADRIGLRTMGLRIPFEMLASKVPLPCIAHWRQNHFVVVYRVSRDKVVVADPGHGLVTYDKQEFLRGWLSADNRNGIVLLAEPTAGFHDQDDEPARKGGGAKFLLPYLAKFRRLITQLLLGVLLEGSLVLVFPFLTQALVDFGVVSQNIGFVYAVLLAQLMLFCGRTVVDFLRSWILLHIGARINVSILSDYLTRLMKLPMRFFDTKLTADILQRVDDHRRVEVFLTSSTLNVLFSFFTLIVCSFILALYSTRLFVVFAGGTAAAALWILAFAGQRRVMDFKLFALRSENRSTLIELVGGMQEIKLNRCEAQRRWRWEAIQARLFRANQRSLIISQYQQAGSLALNEVKNILVTFLAAREVIEGRMTLGMMLAASYMIGQMSGPLLQLLDFVNRVQDARMSLDRLAEIQDHEEESDPRRATLTTIPRGQSLSLRGASFRYAGAEKDVLEEVDLDIPPGKVTAIVGASGSGKTTLLKLLLRFYEPTAGEIRLGELGMRNISPAAWRARCGAVMQDGFVFSDTVARNVALREDEIDLERLQHSLRVANIHEFVGSMPLAYNSRIGPEGQGLSRGQIQRILIARAVWKDPEFLFFDEATSALDAINERTIMDNLRSFFQGRTVVIVAHRLSTVRDADQIIVLDKGRIVERGHHDELTKARRSYYHLVKNQLELGN